MRQRTSGRLNSVAQIVILVVILGVANFLAYRHFARFDFTQDREYTLAPSTRGILEGLNDIVTLDVYFSPNLPAYLADLKNGVRDLLDEYGAYGGLNVQVRFNEPDDDPATEQKMQMLGIPQIQLNIVDKDQFQLTQVYMGMSILYGGKKEIIPVIQDTADLEYQINSAVLKLTRESPVVVAMDAGAQPVPGEGNFSLLQRELGRQYEFRSLSLGGEEPLPGDVSTLIVAAPQSLGEREIFRLDQFVGRGGRLMLLAGGVDLAEGTLRGREVEHGLGPLLEAWGLEIPPEVVVDVGANAPASFSSGYMNFRVPYAYWPNVLPTAFDKEHPVVSRLESLVLPWTSPLVLTDDRPEGLETLVLASSSPRSWRQGAPFDFNPTREPIPPGSYEGGQPLAVLLTGVFRSPFSEDSIPEGVPERERADFIRESLSTSVLVVGDSRFVEDEFLPQFPENGLFIMNAVDWLAQGQQLIGIRSRGSTERPLPDLSERAKATLRYLNMFVVAGLLLVVGGVRLSLRKRRRGL